MATGLLRTLSLIGFVALIIGLFPEPSTAQVHQFTVYTNPGFAGSFCYSDSPMTANIYVTCNDQISSVQFAAGWSARMYRDQNQSGPSLCLSRTDADLADNTFEDGSGANDAISSFVLYNQPWCGGSPTPGYPLEVFNEAGYAGGWCYSWQAETANIFSGCNDQISSVLLRSGWSIRVYRDQNQAGPSRCLTASDDNLTDNTFEDGSGMNDAVSSFILYNQADCPSTPPPPTVTPVPPTPTSPPPSYAFQVFNDPGYTGGMCYSNTPITANINALCNDRVSSIKLQAGWSVRVYRDQNQSGPSRCLTASDSNLPDNTFDGGAGMNDVISSFILYNQPSCPNLPPPPTITPTSPPSSTSLSVLLTLYDQLRDQGFTGCHFGATEFTEGNVVVGLVTLRNTGTTSYALQGTASIDDGLQSLGGQNIPGMSLPPGGSTSVRIVLPSSGWRAWNSAGSRTGARSLYARFSRSGGGQISSAPAQLTIRPRPVVLVHGYNDTGASWSHFDGRLTRSGWYSWVVYSMNTGGYGGNTNTIDRNAQLLGNDIALARSTRCAATVDVLAHSMGGLITRRYIAAYMSTRTINQLLMVATPNGGSFSANVLSGITGSNPIDRAIAERFLRYRYPAITELTTDYLRGFNSINWNRKGVPFYAVAGNKCFPQNPLENLPNDVIVAITSVRAIALTRSWAYPGSGYWDGSCEAEHSKLIRNDDIFNRFVAPLLKGQSATLAGAQVESMLESEEPPVAQPPQTQLSKPQMGMLTTGGRVEFVHPTEPVTTTSFIVIAPNDLVRVSLRSPDGTRYDAATTAAGVTYFDGTEAGVAVMLFKVDNPTPGNWTSIVEATGSLPNSGIPVYSLRSFASETRLVAVTPDNEVTFAEELAVTARLTSSDTPVAGSVNGQLIAPDGSVQAIVLLDDGRHGDGAANDGLYGYIFTPRQIGVYTAGLTASLPSLTTGSNTERSTVWGASVTGAQLFLPGVIR